MGGYYGAAIKKYFDDLYGSSYLRYVVVNHADGRLFGIYDAADLIAYLRTLGEGGYEEFERMLNRGDEQAQAWLARLPGFVAAEHAVTPETSKRAALQAMENLDQDALPVTDLAGRLVGTVERAKLTSSLILAVTERLAGEQPAGNGQPQVAQPCRAEGRGACGSGALATQRSGGLASAINTPAVDARDRRHRAPAPNSSHFAASTSGVVCARGCAPHCRPAAPPICNIAFSCRWSVSASSAVSRFALAKPHCSRCAAIIGKSTPLSGTGAACRALFSSSTYGDAQCQPNRSRSRRLRVRRSPPSAASRR